LGSQLANALAQSFSYFRHVAFSDNGSACQCPDTFQGAFGKLEKGEEVGVSTSSARHLDLARLHTLELSAGHALAETCVLYR
jgi:hypothetical protein